MSQSKPNEPVNAGTDPDAEDILRDVIKLSRVVMGLTLGVLFSLAIFGATLFLVLKGGDRVGAHLQLLGQFFPGYRVTFLGSIIGGAYGFVFGYLTGWIVAAVYNWVVLLKRN